MIAAAIAAGLALSSAACIAAWYLGSEGKGRPRAGVLRRQGRAVALLGGTAQLTVAALFAGWLGGAGLVLAAWMLLGLVFVLAVNVSPARVVKGALALGALGALLVVGGWLG